MRPDLPVKGTTNVPGPPTRRWPLIGDALWFISVRNMEDMFRVIKSISLSRPRIVSFYLFSKLILWIYDAEMLQKIAKNCPDKDDDVYGQIADLSHGIVTTTDNERWTVLRMTFNKILRKTKMDDFVDLFASKAKITCEKIQGKCGKGVFDMMAIIKFYTLDITLEVFLEVPGTQQLNDTLNILPGIRRSLNYVLLKLLNPLLKIGWIYRLSPLGRRIRNTKLGVKPKLQMLVDQSLEKMKARGSDPKDPNFEPNNFLEALIYIGLQQNSSRDEIAHSVSDIIVAGFDTTGTSISSTLLFLAMHPEYQEMAYQEQLRVVGDSLRPPTRAEISNMIYLDMVFNETLRNIGVPIIFRVLQAETKIDDFVLPEGAAIGIMFCQIAKDPRYFEKPNVFYPEHFSVENVAKRPKFASIPFSFGNRGCPGKIFGTTYSKLIISMLLRRHFKDQRPQFVTPSKRMKIFSLVNVCEPIHCMFDFIYEEHETWMSRLFLTSRQG
ncbi:hypothetical protein GE061_009796 [Apolygus lucorum]|uniref:Cytochrome P450 n=1 Tax=Apolygus lucorum TaxID=248454 RepID=A0A8S9Y1I0_APOLU|nr:hypothetical protein GE061_009796 [Apolygus lucorum]